MSNQLTHTAYVNISQRAVFPYLVLSAQFNPVKLDEKNGGWVEEQADLHAFFQALYSDIYAQPERFGLPVRPDDCIAENQPNEKDKKQEVKRLLDRPKAMIEAGLDFIMKAGIQGVLDGKMLRIEHYPAILTESKITKKFLAGLEGIGIVVSTSGDQAIISNARFSAMIPALQALAKRCAAYSDERLGKFVFATCDFRALNGYETQAQDLYHAFDGAEAQLVTDLHEYFESKGYKAEIDIHAPGAWTVKYQGDRKVKSSPLYQVDYLDRYLRPLRMQIKCASTHRLEEVLPSQPQFLKDDLERRVSTCRGDECRWCQTRSYVRPAVLEFHGEPRTVCWYTNPDVRDFDDQTIELIQQYEQMHALLAAEE